MKITKCKLTAIILITVIFASIFFVGWSNGLNKINTEMYPVFENSAEEDMSFVEQINQILSWNKSIFLRLDIKYILLSITGIEDSYIIRLYNLKSDTLEFYFYSVLIMVFINKMDGKKDNMFICYHK